jgi:N-glycosylase/DNA lyase
MKLSQIPAPDFDLEKTLNSGQVFHWEKMGDAFWGTIDEIPLGVEQRGSSLKIMSPGPELDWFNQSSSGQTEGGTTKQRVKGVVAHYFALDHPLPKICATFPNDPAMTAARDFCRGLRIIRQPRWECLATFITSSMKQVAHIRQISLALRQRYGATKRIFDHEVYTYPSAQRVAQLTEDELRTCALGYRAKNLLATARRVATGEANLDEWANLSDESLRQKLCELPGVGAKVANCVMLFAYERLRAFPIDVWIERVLKQQYFPRKRKVTAQQLRVFCDTYFGAHGGYAQQYLFHHARKGGPAVVRPGDVRYDLPVKSSVPCAAPK